MVTLKHLVIALTMLLSGCIGESEPMPLPEPCDAASPEPEPTRCYRLDAHTHAQWCLENYGASMATPFACFGDEPPDPSVCAAAWSIDPDRYCCCDPAADATCVPVAP